MSKQFSRRGMLKTSFLGSLAAGLATFAGTSQAAEPKKDEKEVYDAIILGAGPAGLVTAIAAKQAGAKKVVVFEKKDRPDGNAIFALGSVCGWGAAIRKNKVSKIPLKPSTP